MPLENWNYRVGKKGELIALYEAYYDQKVNITAMSSCPVLPEAETLAELPRTIYA